MAGAPTWRNSRQPGLMNGASASVLEQRKYSCTVYLDLETQKWVAKGYQSRAAKAEAIRIYTQTMGA